MGIVSSFRWDSRSPEASWFDADKAVVKRYPLPILNAMPLKDGTGVALVEHPDIAGRKNAVAFNSDGSERFRPTAPVGSSEDCWFIDMYYVCGELTAFAALGGNDLACVIDPDTGAFVRSYVTR